MARLRSGILLGVAVLSCLTACGPPEIEDFDPDEDDRAACEAFVAALPDDLAGYDRVEVDPSDALGAAWGDPPIVVTCGVPVPEDFSATSSCDEVNGVGFFIPREVVDNADEPAVVTTPGYRPIIEIEVPAGSSRGDDTAAATADLAPLVEEYLELDNRCG